MGMLLTEQILFFFNPNSTQDPVFQPDGFDKTYAELDSDIKNSISHRGRALEKLKKHFEENNLFVKEQ